MIVEVTSPSTEEYDRGEKLEWYRQIPGLDSVVLVSHREPLIEVDQRSGDGWVRRSAKAGGRIELPVLGCSVAVDEIYAATR